MLPIIDFKPFREGDPLARQEVAKRIGDACESIGFMYVANHGVASDTIEAAVRATREFFAQPLERRRAVARRPGTYRGYIPMMPFSEDRASGRSFLYEAFILGPEIAPREASPEELRWPNVWPD